MSQEIITKIVIFGKKEIRKVIYNKEWWFSVADVIEALTDTVDIRDYIKKMRKRDKDLDSYWGTNCPLLEMFAKDGKKRKITSANTEGIFRIIQSIPSPKAEPFKRWLARVGYERIQEIEDPELAARRTRAIYKAKGYSDAWIEKRMRGIEVRETLTNEWKNRGVKEGLEYAILTAEISKATFGMTPSEYQNFKGLKRENLRDHMGDLELIFSMLGEASTTEIAKNKNAIGFNENKIAAVEGGSVAGKARKDLEKKSGKKVSTSNNYLNKSESKKRLK
ncbi:MAG: Prophage antirepressor [Candidatus Falkowbacteria bacterium GW2011_GWC2_38_22]|uniref:Prophage antirepressor n=1 Tax=Candidatus Falkowbacteria bacterium GW2011_GWE1_38_31 TaxID=1618638 RepID=A0A0G0JSJ0_9BACT|nr:MAG: Prophage antirepressor [Candidatus Falkowbacteria bacterium GW2011_GWF2_38_1205]KKQ61730.1 MAG: Prophage antirepressor [Candidatus Falkowbacteria bacterium GW2011_GWC2_38_22]KKQ63655.1 MAG: Prophage antirepressor [Candidatus Falkowbacteria bacterium GW2011_GWF1_38_22]KKQ65929.1 MAG: Prophage antirepressor [Candidatus Falkowbacteria bacterium GW2011_GWE2_38_254]KKQ70518.1 MAG: Prophage antirepressor [Candidatus Falkowbacteria bacterium GW2011_GWE1_38_31]KKQ72914.1 MAG: Prophage antirepr